MVLKTVGVALVCLLPLLGVGWTFYYNGPGPNPVETLLYETGVWALRLLLLTLLVRPLWQALHLSGPFVWLRRTLGLMAFFYVTLHLLVYFIFDLNLDLAAVWEDLTTRPFILVGMLAYLLLVPLALTSSVRWQQRLGRAWARLHRLVYGATFLGVLHFLLLVKNPMATLEPWLYLGVWAGLMGVRSRFFKRLRRRIH